MTNRDIIPPAKRARQPESDHDLARALIDEAIPPQRWLEIFERLAQSNSPKAIELLLHYRFGQPAAAPDKRDAADARFVIVLPPIEGGPADYGTNSLAAAPGAAGAIPPERRR